MGTLNVYIATPVNGRTEATLLEKQKTAQQRCYKLMEEIKKHYPDAECWSSVTNMVIARQGLPEREADIMGNCVRHVMLSDIVFLDWGHVYSKGCGIEQFVASTYGKKIIYAKDLGIEPENIMEKYGIDPTKENQSTKEWQPKTFQEACEIVRANPITNDMTYEERLAAQKRRFGL